MPRLRILTLVLAALVTGCNIVSARDLQTAETAETKYLVFQVWPAMPGYPGIPPLPGRMALSKEQMAEFVHSVVKAIGTTGDARHKLGFAVGPLCFDVPDEEIRQWIRDALAVARENDVAVALHIDDSMSWGGARACSPILTTSRRRTGSKFPMRDGAWLGGRSRRSFRRRCVTTRPPSWRQRRTARG